MSTALTISAMALRIDADEATAVEASKHLVRQVGTITNGGHDHVDCTVHHPDGREVQLRLKVSPAPHGTYLEIDRHSGDALLGADVYRIFLCMLTKTHDSMPGLTDVRGPPPGLCNTWLPPPPRCGPAAAPRQVPELSLCLENEIDWSTLDALAEWPREEMRDFAYIHGEVCTMFGKGQLEPMHFEQHMLKMPPAVRKGLKWAKTRWNILPTNTATLLEQISQLTCEAEVFWTMHGC